MATEIVGDFEWDTEKADANWRKHGVTFTEAVRAFIDPFAVDLRDATYPDRLVLLGMTLPERLLYVVYTEKDTVRQASHHQCPEGYPP
jgi:uncharacterized protein